MSVKDMKLPNRIHRGFAQRILDGSRANIIDAFMWSDTPQGSLYWCTRWEGKVKLSMQDRQYIRRAMKEVGY